jgi:succinate-semialdehyde dehydrogenase / glutarate-semialdehyde dehydrogenase
VSEPNGAVAARDDEVPEEPSHGVAGSDPSGPIAAEIDRRVPPTRLASLATLVAPASGPRAQRPVIAPFTAREVGRIPWLTPDDVAAAAREARTAQAEWSRLPWRDRARVFTRFHDRVLDRREEVMDLIQVETGKARFHAMAEVADVALVSRHYIHRGRRLLSLRRRRGAFPLITRAWERRIPKGLVGVLSTWNYPLSIAITDAIPALLAGNAVLLKPDERTPFTALWCLEQLREAGLPDRLFQIVTGDGAAIGEALVFQSDYVHFTGSTPTCRKVADLAAQRLIGCSLELGGKNPLIVLEDADLDRTVEGAIQACFANAGQLCVAAESLYVHQARYGEFRARFLQRVAAMRMGPSFELGTEMGSLISRAQLDKVRQHLAEAVDGGARVLIGGRHRPDLGPFFFEPTVLEGVRAGMRLCDEETFGPVVALYPFRDDDEVVRLVNASPFGLHASVWTRRPRYARDLAARLQMGMVNINDAWGATWGSVDAPMGGVKASGIGRRHGAEGIRKYTEEQTVALQRWIPLAVPPHRERLFQRALTGFLWIARRVPGLR